MAENKYLQLESSTGTLFEYSKTEKDGFEKHINTKNTISYRKYYKDGVFGKLKGISVRNTDFGDSLSIYFEDLAGNRIFVGIQLMDVKGNISSYSAGVIAYMPYLVENEDYRFFPFAIPREDNPEKKNYGVSIKYADLANEDYDNTNLVKKLGQSYFDRQSGALVEKEIPAGIWSKDFKGVDTLDSTEKNKFLWDTLQANLIGNQESAGSSKGGYNRQATAQPQEQPAPKATPTTTAQAPAPTKEAPKTAMKPNAKFDANKVEEAQVVDEEEDDLPF